MTKKEREAKVKAKAVKEIREIALAARKQREKKGYKFNSTKELRKARYGTSGS